MKSLKFIFSFALFNSGIFLFFSTSYGQTPTYRRLMELVRDENNNEYKLEDAKPIHDKNRVWSNIFFRYYKNPNWAETNGKEVMILSVGIEYVIQARITDELPIVFNFPNKTPKDIVELMKLSTYDPASPNKSEKIKKKYYELIPTDSTFKLQIDREALTTGSVLKIYCKIESFYFREFKPFANIDLPNADYIYSINQPSIVRYSIPKEISSETLEHSVSKFKLISFVKTSPPLVDYPVFSASIKSKLNDPEEKDNVIFTLESLSVPVRIGMDIEHLVQYDGKK